MLDKKSFGSVEDKVLYEKGLKLKIGNNQGKWEKRTHKITLQAPYEVGSFRIRVNNEIKDSDHYILEEGIRPEANGKLTYLELLYRTREYGTFQEYTDKALKNGFDNLVGDLGEIVKEDFTAIKDNISAKAWFKGNNIITANNGITREILNRIRINLQKFAGNDKQVYCYITPEDMTDLRTKYNAPGANLFQDLQANQDSVINGVLTKFEGIIFEEDSSALMYNDNTRNAIFWVADKSGKSPVGSVEASGNNVEVITKELKDGGTENALAQKGSVGVKAYGLGAVITSEETLIRLEITPATNGISGSKVKLDTHYNLLNGKIIVEGKTIERTAQTNFGTSPIGIFLSGKGVVGVGKDITLEVANEKGEVIAGSSVTWKSSDITVATVANGKVSGVKKGETIILATKDGKTATYKITVE